MRDTYNSNPLNPHDAVARLPGSFDSIPHDVNQPLNAAIRTHLGNHFRSTPLAILQPRTAIAWQIAPKDGVADWVRSLQRHSAGKRRGLGGHQSALRRRPFRAVCWAHVGGTAIAPGVPNSAVDATIAANQAFSFRLRAGPALLRVSAGEPATLSSTRRHYGRARTANYARLISWSGASAWSIRSERPANLRAQYVGTRAVNQPYLTQVNGYQTVCQGCFAPFPYGAADGPEIRRRHAALHRRQQSLQRPSTDRRRSASGTACRYRRTTPGAIAWTPSRTAGSCRSPRAGILSPLPGRLWRAITARAITMSGTTSPPVCLPVADQGA